jgi:hypothetical protein
VIGFLAFISHRKRSDQLQVHSVCVFSGEILPEIEGKEVRKESVEQRERILEYFSNPFKGNRQIWRIQNKTKYEKVLGLQNPRWFWEFVGSLRLKCRLDSCSQKLRFVQAGPNKVCCEK